MTTLVATSRGMVRVLLAILLLGAAAGCGGSNQGQVLTDNLSAPLDGATTAKVDINCGAGNLTIDRLTGGEPLLAQGENLLAGGTLQYLEKQGLPTRTLDASNGQATLTLRGNATGGSGFRLPWQACAGGAYAWQIHLNPAVAYDITARSEGGDVRLDLAGMALTRLAADTGGGNVDVVLPANAANLSVSAKTGAGNVTVLVPSGIVARVHATSGLGKVIVDSRFSQIDSKTYQSPDYDGAANKVEITVSSGAGNVSVNSK